MKVLVLTGHDDDVTVHAGGLICKLVDRGHEVTAVVMTLGQRGQRFGGELAWDVRAAETINAYGELGITPNFDFARYEQEYDIDSRTRGEASKFFTDYKPDLVIAHWPVDCNPDHRAAAVLAMEPVFQKGVNTEILFFKPLSSGRESAKTRPQVTCFIPTHYLPLNRDILDRKTLAIHSHVSQDPDGMWIGQVRVQAEDADDLHEDFPEFLPRVHQVECYIAGKRAGAMIPELTEILVPTPYKFPRAVVRHDPMAYGVNEPPTLLPEDDIPF